MKNTFKYKAWLIVLFVVTVITSCKEDFLELNPPTSLVPEKALGLEADVQVALRGAYAGLRTGIAGSTADFFGRTVPVLGDVMADNAYQHSTNTNRYTLFNYYTFNVTDPNVLGLWSSAYAAILRANNIINSTAATSVNVNQYKGEAYAIRALCYFTLVRYFSKPYTDDPNALGVPLITTYDPELKPGRSTVAETYALINDDLTQAFTLMTLYTNSSQFSKYAARGLQAKVYLTMGDNVKAKAAALEVINNGGFTPLTTANHAAYWANGALRTDKLETLFEVSSDNVANLAFDALSYLYSQAGNYGDFLISNDLYSSFAAADVRLALYPKVIRPKPSGPLVNSVNKFPVITGDYSDTKVLRLSEIYLIAAEASLPGSEADALTYVNFVTSRRGTPAIASTGAQLFEDIITERRKELAFEGDRYLDLQRLKRDVTRNATNYPASALSIPYSNFRRILPIPQVETDANPTIKAQQNPLYQ